jgi:iron complex outermembrane receptor protein
MLCLGATALGSLAIPAWADPPSPPEGQQQDAADQILVVARRLTERLVDVPIAVTTLNGEDLRRWQAVDLSGIQGTVPNLNIVQGRGSSTSINITIRGIGQPDPLQTFDPAVGVYVDGVYFSRVQGQLLDLFDVDHIEILRGPQGTLYGKNTIGGAVNIISRQPDWEQVHADGSFGYGAYDQRLANAYLTLPLIADKLALSLAGNYDRRDGTVTDPLTGRKYNDRNTQTGRAILRAQPSETVQIDLEADYTREHTQPTLGYPTAPINKVDLLTGATPLLAPAYPYGPYHFEDSTGLAAGDGQTLHHWGVALTARVEISDRLTATSISAYRRLRSNAWLDLDATPYSVGDIYVGMPQHQLSQELQLQYDHGPLRAVAGLYYLDEHVSTRQVSLTNDFILLGDAPATLSRISADRQVTQSYAGFGQLIYDFTDTLSFTAGVRYTRDRKSYVRSTYTILNGVVSSPFLFPASLPAPYDTLDHVDFGAWTPSFSLSYKPSTDTQLYVSVSRGYKSGGFNGRADGLSDLTRIVDGVPTIVPFFKPETVWTYEGGAKGSFGDGLVSLAGDVFYSDYRNFQARVGGSSLTLDSGDTPVLNAAKLRIWGTETELAIKPTRAWSLRADIGYENARYLRFDDERRPPTFSCNPTGSHVICKPAFSPPLSASLRTDYAIDLGQWGSLTLGADTRFIGNQWLSVDNAPGLYEPGYWLFDATAEYRPAHGNWSLRLGVRNISDTIYKTDAQNYESVGNIQTVYYGDPRTWTATIGFRY